MGFIDMFKKPQQENTENNTESTTQEYQPVLEEDILKIIKEKINRKKDFHNTDDDFRILTSLLYQLQTFLMYNYRFDFKYRQNHFICEDFSRTLHNTSPHFHSLYEEDNLKVYEKTKLKIPKEYQKDFRITKRFDIYEATIYICVGKKEYKFISFFLKDSYEDNSTKPNKNVIPISNFETPRNEDFKYKLNFYSTFLKGAINNSKVEFVTRFTDYKNFEKKGKFF